MHSLANKGRYGDNKIRKIDGKPAHVNSNEASLLDFLGKPAESIIKMVGAGTTNPMTGLKEYHSPGETFDEEGNVLTAGTIHTGAAWDETGYHSHFFSNGARRNLDPPYGSQDNPLTDEIEGPQQYQYGAFQVGEFDKFMEMFQTGDIRDYAKEEFGIKGDKFDKFVTTPFDAATKLQDEEKLYGLKMSGLQSDTTTAMSDINTALGRSGFATSGQAAMQQEQLMQNYQDIVMQEDMKYRDRLDTIKGDIIAGFTKQMAQLA
mgnify:CR=1 FL=1|tara:strand:+ start:926 stop:1711 length:786 start_codon:yes stop_codon:yes gene_type:complete